MAHNEKVALVLSSQCVRQIAKVVVVEPTGAETELLVEVGQGDAVQRLVVVMHGRTQAQPDDTVHLSLDPAKAHVFDANGGARLG